LRIAVIGATTEALPRLTTPNLLGEWHALPVIDTVRKAVAEVKGQSDIVVLIGHLTAPEELETLKSITEIPVIVSGHVHNGLPAPTEVDGRVLVRVRSYAQELGRLDLDWDTDAHRIKKWSWKRTPIDAKVPAAGDVAKIVAKWDKKVAKMVDVPIGTSRRNLTQKDLKPIMERAMVEEMKADFAFMNPGGIRDQIPLGTVLARHVWNVMPFDNKVVVGVVKGRDLPKAIRDGRSIDPGRDYRLAVTDFTAENQGEMGSKGLKFTETGPVFRDLLVDWIKKQKVLN
jgi:2',3'-cyclic-nucleotide 2'-phosphodiesterase (5'-nucleotidase family)